VGVVGCGPVVGRDAAETVSAIASCESVAPALRVTLALVAASMSLDSLNTWLSDDPWVFLSHLVAMIA
jgi:hypothetical protein